MGDGYAILMWDEWGYGLVRVNPRLLTIGEDPDGNPMNWFSCDYNTPIKIIALKHGLNLDDEGQKWSVIR